jgi:hypothetical protein
VKLNDKLAGVSSVVQSGQMPPSRQAREVFVGLSQQLQVQLDRLQAVETKEVVEFNALLKSKGLTPVVPKTPAFAAAGGRRRGGGNSDAGDDSPDQGDSE